MHEIVPPRETKNEDDTTEIAFAIDASGIVETPRQLPGGAGTDAFVRAYNARFPGLDAPASERTLNLPAEPRALNGTIAVRIIPFARRSVARAEAERPPR
jgi:hypothetical protein